MTHETVGLLVALGSVVGMLALVGFACSLDDSGPAPLPRPPRPSRWVRSSVRLDRAGACRGRHPDRVQA